MSTVAIEEAQARLPELIQHLIPGEDVVITENDRPVAQLSAPSSETAQPVLGRCQGMLTIIAEDDEPMADWSECLP